MAKHFLPIGHAALFTLEDGRPHELEPEPEPEPEPSPVAGRARASLLFPPHGFGKRREAPALPAMA